MAKSHVAPFMILVFFILFAGNFSSCRALDDDRKVYVVYMGALIEDQISSKSLQLNVLEQVLRGRPAADSLLYSYKRSFNGFAAKLTPQEKQRISGMDGVVSVFESKSYRLQTTRSWDFMGFPTTVNRSLELESDVIIGIIDSGAWPESKSFNDNGMGPPPKKWKGTCQTAGNFSCNNKLIGARFYPPHKSSPGDSARDTQGHGTHTASIAAGSQVKDASLFGLAQGTARGAVPSARIAIYKACWSDGCFDHTILAAFDDAISDGVDILSLSLAPDTSADYDTDSIAIGAYHAMKSGILTSQSAGNNGPTPKLIGSVAPWILTVAASNTDRQIVTKVELGNGRTLVGNSINTFDLGTKQFNPLIYGGDAAVEGCRGTPAELCREGCLDRKLTEGKIVFCEGDENQGMALIQVGALGMIARGEDELFNDFSTIYPLPSSFLDSKMCNSVKFYINTTKEPKANILKSESIHNSAAPIVASFSSRGPNIISKDILKPDVSAPGVDILAAFSPVAPLSGVSDDKRFTDYNIISGTSMACPHATGAAAYVKSFHPNWSPAAIKSALMTTASPMNGNKNPFDYGAGHIDPVLAIQPGLVYDAVESDYVKMLCSEGYRRRRLELITGHKNSCPATSTAAKDLNYASMTVLVKSTGQFESSFTRTVTHVGLGNSTYIATVMSRPQFNIQVIPSRLNFKATGDKKTFVVKVTGTMSTDKKVLDTFIVWSNGFQHVKSPLVVYGDDI